MKKMLLLLVSGLLITCMAGSAMAMSLDLLSGSSVDSSSVAGGTIELAVDQTKDIYLKVNCDSSTGERDFDVIIEKVDPATDLAIAGAPVYLSSSVKTLKVTLTPNTVFVYQSPITLKMEPGAVPGDVYRVAVGSDTFRVSATTHVTSVPEFPTVALPIAAVIGLVFIFGRKKEGL
jgi:hypothetical protein